MKYLEFIFKTEPSNQVINDILCAMLGDAGFESFVEQEDGSVAAYIQITDFDEKKLREAVADFPLADTRITYTWKEAEDRDWNEEWEKNYFQPIVIGQNRCVVHSTFHHDIPHADYDIVINPQMAFGTGHHQTTGLMMSELLDMNLSRKRVLDMGCGTSILAILARMRGAKECVAIDIDEWCVRNSLENISLNHVDHIKVFQGDASSLTREEPFDIILANINRNILLRDMPAYKACLMPEGELLISGFYNTDIPLLQQKAYQLRLELSDTHENENWAMVRFKNNS